MAMNDVKRDAVRNLARLGKIKLGIFAPGKNGGAAYPQATPFYQFRQAPKLARFYGDREVDELAILFPFVEFERNIEGFHRVWAGGGGRRGGICVCKGDGDQVVSALPFRTSEKENGGIGVYRAPGDRLVDDGVAYSDFNWNGSTFEPGMTVPCSGRRHDLYPHCQACTPSTVLKVMIREPEELVEYGYYQIATRSISNYKHFLAVWENITDDGALSVPMNAVPFILKIMPQGTVYQNKENRMWMAGDNFFLRLLVDLDTLKTMKSARETRLDRLLVGSIEVNAPLFEAAPEPESVEEHELEQADLESAPPDNAFVDGEFSEADAAAQNGGKATRPYDAQVLVAKLREIAETAPAEQQIQVTSPDDVRAAGICYTNLGRCFEGEIGAAAMAELVIFAAFEVTAPDLTIAQIGALQAWLLKSKGNTGEAAPLHEHAPAEAMCLYVDAVAREVTAPAPF